MNFSWPGCVTPSGKKVSLNETWMEDDCTTCVCRDGQTKCQASFCRTPCLHPRKVPGECCPVCDGNFCLSIQISPRPIVCLIAPTSTRTLRPIQTCHYSAKHRLAHL